MKVREYEQLGRAQAEAFDRIEWYLDRLPPSSVVEGNRILLMGYCDILDRLWELLNKEQDRPHYDGPELACGSAVTGGEALTEWLKGMKKRYGY